MNDVTKKRWAGAINNGVFICVDTYSGYRSSIRDPKGSQYFLGSDSSDEILGSILLDSLAHSRFVLPAPRDDVWIHPDVEFDIYLYDYIQGINRYAAWVADLMGRYGYKTKRALFKNMMNCGIEQLNNMITITPMRHIKLEMWEGLSADGIENVVIPSTSTPAEIGAALRLAFSRCT